MCECFDLGQHRFPSTGTCAVAQKGCEKPCFERPVRVYTVNSNSVVASDDPSTPTGTPTTGSKPFSHGCLLARRRSRRTAAGIASVGTDRSSRNQSRDLLMGSSSITGLTKTRDKREQAGALPLGPCTCFFVGAGYRPEVIPARPGWLSSRTEPGSFLCRLSNCQQNTTQIAAADTCIQRASARCPSTSRPCSLSPSSSQAF